MHSQNFSESAGQRPHLTRQCVHLDAACFVEWAVQDGQQCLVADVRPKERRVLALALQVLSMLIAVEQPDFLYSKVSCC